MDVKFTGSGPSFNQGELDRLIDIVQHSNVERASSVTIDLSPYAFLGLHETQVLLLLLRSLARRSVAQKTLRLPDCQYRENVLKFLERWNFFSEIGQHPEDYFLNKVTAGSAHSVWTVLRSLGRYERSSEYVSKRLMPITRIYDLQGAVDYVGDLHRPNIQSVLVGQLSKSLREVSDFADVIVFELLKNVVHHVIAFKGEWPKPSYPESPRVGFVSMATYDEEHRRLYLDRYDVDIFARDWPDFLRDSIASYNNGFVELSVVDDGAGMLETLSDQYLRVKGERPKDDAEILRFACEAGTSRYHAMENSDVSKEFSRLLSELRHKSLTDLPQAISEYLSRLGELKPDVTRLGYGLFLVKQKIADWGGVLVIRTGSTYYTPVLPSTGGEFVHSKHTGFPGVQIRVLLPR